VRTLRTLLLITLQAVSAGRALGADGGPPSAAEAPKSAPGREENPNTSQTSAAAAPTENPNAARARAAEDAYEQAISLYSVGDKTGALAAMEGSYRLSERPELLYNLAKLKRELGQCQAALSDYHEYLARVPTGPYRDKAEQASRELETECPRPETKRRYWTTARVLGWSAIGAGTLAGSAALYYVLAARSAGDDAQKSLDAAVRSKVDWATTNGPQREQDKKDAESRAEVLAVVTGTLIVGGVALLIFGPADEDRERPSVSIAIQPGTALFGYSGSF
jgi:hypothetical protein